MPVNAMLGCQTFTWEMLGDDWNGGPDDLVDAISAAGYTGIEITDTMIGDYAGRPNAFKQRLDQAGLSLVAFAFGAPSGFTTPESLDEDLETARKWVEFVAGFPGALASMGSATIVSDGPRADKFSVAADVYNRCADIADAAGVGLAVHPSSHHNTLLFTRQDYEEIFQRLDPKVGWVPDTGHMIRGGMRPEDTMTAFGDRIRYVHLKDADATGAWAMLGDGACDVAAVAAAAAAAKTFNGWFVIEEESDVAANDPADAVARNHQTARHLLGLQHVDAN